MRIGSLHRENEKGVNDATGKDTIAREKWGKQALPGRN